MLLIQHIGTQQNSYICINKKNMIINIVMTYKDGLFTASISLCMHLHSVRVLNSDGKSAQQ